MEYRPQSPMSQSLLNLLTRQDVRLLHHLFFQHHGLHGLDQEFNIEDYIVLTDKDKEQIIELSKNPEIADLICKSIAPSIYGYEDVKEALVLQLFSGIRKALPDGTTLRGNINIALIGDPSTAKSQLVRYITEISPRGVFTSGRNVSAPCLHS